MKLHCIIQNCIQDLLFIQFLLQFFIGFSFFYSPLSVIILHLSEFGDNIPLPPPIARLAKTTMARRAIRTTATARLAKTATARRAKRTYHRQPMLIRIQRWRRTVLCRCVVDGHQQQQQQKSGGQANGKEWHTEEIHTYFRIAEVFLW
jgi:hypothetical protein